MGRSHPELRDPCRCTPNGCPDCSDPPPGADEAGVCSAKTAGRCPEYARHKPMRQDLLAAARSSRVAMTAKPIPSTGPASLPETGWDHPVAGDRRSRVERALRSGSR